MGDSAEFATVARIRRPQGRHGEVSVDLFTDFPERFEAGLGVSLWCEGQPRRETQLENAWPHKRGMVLKFSGVESINDAEQLNGWEVQVPVSSRPALQGQAAYHSDLIGCRVTEHDELLGVVTAIEERTGTPLLIVTGESGELLIPFATEICKVVDTDRGVVEVELPEGLRELNR